MMEVGGAEARNQLFAKTQEYLLSHGVNKINLSSMQASAAGQSMGYSENDKKIQNQGDIGQGEGLADAKRARTKK